MSNIIKLISKSLIGADVTRHRNRNDLENTYLVGVPMIYKTNTMFTYNMHNVYMHVFLQDL